MKAIIINIAPEDPIGPDGPYYPDRDPGDYPPENPGNEKNDPVIPPMDPDPEPYEPDIDPDSIIPDD